jgi:hypothetical protein
VSYRLADSIGESSFEPLPDFAHDDADVFIISLIRNVAYSREIEDPIYKAREQITFQLASSTTPLWISNLSVTGFGCINQYEVCAHGKCTDPNGLFRISNANGEVTDSLNLNPTQAATLAVIWRSFYASQPSVLSTVLGSDLLRSRERIPTGDTAANVQNPNASIPAQNYYYSTPVNSFQWQVEAQNLQNVALASLQQSVVDHVAPADYLLAEGVSARNYLLHSTDPGEKHVCSAQKVRSSAYASFSVFGLVFIIVAGVIITILAFAVPAVLNFYQTQSGTADSLHRRDEWYQADVLQLSRAVSENQNPGAWTGSGTAVPTTTDFNKQMTWKLQPASETQSFLMKGSDVRNGASPDPASKEHQV